MRSPRPVWSVLAALSCVLSASGALGAEAPWAVVLEQGAKAPALSKSLAALKKDRALAWVKPAKGFPKVMAAKALPGLPAGRQFAVLGVCGTKEEAEGAMALVRPWARTASVQQLTGDAALSCPTPNALKSPLQTDAKVEATHPFPDAPGLVLTEQRVNPKTVMECKASDLLLRVSHGSTVLTEVLLKGQCLGACSPEEQRTQKVRIAELQASAKQGNQVADQLLKDLTPGCMSRESRVVKVLTELGMPMAAVSLASELESSPMPSGVLMAPGCGKLVQSPYLTEPGREDLSRVKVVADKPGADAWRRFNVSIADQHAAHLVWTARQCEWRMDDPEPEGQDM
ncbi:hypothetical protein JYK02_39290 [Corallococcus macrosporus]|uniref:Uncharacterized protein n=1 Tax=Corallococcus macrosporus TaxID=35 RepID=A0ABS3DQI3_9BACT|nr:hypothetical protein [Corallococcus macrosporus]MBN8233584.1 hypothetical protein [Corallococcus macrosporus]